LLIRGELIFGEKVKRRRESGRRNRLIEIGWIQYLGKNITI